MTDDREANKVLRERVQTLALIISNEAGLILSSANKLEGAYRGDLEAFTEKLEWLWDELSLVEQHVFDVVEQEQKWLTQIGQSETHAAHQQ